MGFFFLLFSLEKQVVISYIVIQAYETQIIEKANKRQKDKSPGIEL